MKEITRRLYTKPVMLGMAFLVGMALVVTLFVTAKSTAAPATFPLVAGNDEFETPGNGETFHDFGGSPIPANFFGAGSLAYSGFVALQGVPLGPGSNVDTIIQRNQTVAGPGGSTTLTMTALSLAGSSSITVTYQNNTTEQWNVAVNLSDYKASTGSMTINNSTFDSNLKVWPKFTFTKVGGGGTKVLDTGAPATTAAATSVSRSSSMAIEPAAIAIAPCKAVISDVNQFESAKTANSATLAAAAASCAPVTLSSVNQPWGPCNPNVFCITVPITEEERWARHRPHPRAVVQVGVAE